MNIFHCIIAVERRSAPRQLAWEANADIVTEASKGVFKITPMPPQLRAMGESVTDDPNVLAAIEWDQTSPWIIAHRGAQADFKVQLLGWPLLTKAEYDSSI